MKVLVVGATGATGKLVVADLLARGQEVTALVRRPGSVVEGIREVVGDALDPERVAAAVRGQDAVVVVLGIKENPLWVLLWGASSTATNVRSQGTRNVVSAMKKEGVKRLIVQTTYGVAETSSQLSLAWWLVFKLILRPQIDDTEIQEQIVRDSGLDWIVARPVGLTDDPGRQLLSSADGEIESMAVPRVSVARFLADQVDSTHFLRRHVALSAR